MGRFAALADRALGITDIASPASRALAMRVPHGVRVNADAVAVAVAMERRLSDLWALQITSRTGKTLVAITSAVGLANAVRRSAAILWAQVELERVPF